MIAWPQTCSRILSRCSPSRRPATRRYGERCAEFLRPIADEKQIAVSIEGAARAGGDGDALARELDNLIKNAIEASTVGGTRGMARASYTVAPDRTIQP